MKKKVLKVTVSPTAPNRKRNQHLSIKNWASLRQSKILSYLAFITTTERTCFPPLLVGRAHAHQVQNFAVRRDASFLLVTASTKLTCWTYDRPSNLELMKMILWYTSMLCLGETQLFLLVQENILYHRIIVNPKIKVWV